MVERFTMHGAEGGGYSWKINQWGNWVRSSDYDNVAEENRKLRVYAQEATKAITGLTAGGSEFFGKQIGDIYTADLQFCVEHIRERFKGAMDAKFAIVRLKAENLELRAKLETVEAETPDYDAGLLNDYGGGDVGWWQDYLRAEIGRANDHWRDAIRSLKDKDQQNG